MLSIKISISASAVTNGWDVVVDFVVVLLGFELAARRSANKFWYQSDKSLVVVSGLIVVVEVEVVVDDVVGRLLG